MSRGEGGVNKKKQIFVVLGDDTWVVGTTRDTKGTKKDIINLGKEKRIQPTKGVKFIKCIATK